MSEMTKEDALKMQKVEAEIAKLMAETMKIQKESFWYPIAISGGLIAAVAAAVKIFF